MSRIVGPALVAALSFPVVPALAQTADVHRLPAITVPRDRLIRASRVSCREMPPRVVLKAALDAAVAAENTGLHLPMWGTIVNRDGVVCAVVFSGANRGSEWPGSRIISAQKANTANAFSLDRMALSTANLYAAVQPGGSLFGLQDSNPVDIRAAYRGAPRDYGTPKDPMVGYRIGGVNVFGGGLALYDTNGRVVGAVGVSGDTSCTDHRVAWRVRTQLGLGNLAGVKGVSADPQRPDNIIFDIGSPAAGGFGHPHCTKDKDGDPATLPAVRRITSADLLPDGGHLVPDGGQASAPGAQPALGPGAVPDLRHGAAPALGPESEGYVVPDLGGEQAPAPRR